MPGHLYTSVAGLIFLALVLGGMGISGWQSSPHFWHKTNFLVVVIGIPIIAVLLAIGWFVVKPRAVASTGNQLKAVWSNDGPTTYDDAGAHQRDDRGDRDPDPSVGWAPWTIREDDHAHRQSNGPLRLSSRHHRLARRLLVGNPGDVGHGR